MNTIILTQAQPVRQVAAHIFQTTVQPSVLPRTIMDAPSVLVQFHRVSMLNPNALRKTAVVTTTELREAKVVSPFALRKANIVYRIAFRKTKIVYRTAFRKTKIVYPIALRKAKTAYSFGLSECIRIHYLIRKAYGYTSKFIR